MSAQRINPKSMRRIERATGLEVLRGWANGGYILEFATPTPEGHRHGWIDKRTGQWALDGSLPHYSSCQELG